MLIVLQISNKNFVNYLNANTERNGLVYKYRFLLTLFFLTVPPRQKKKKTLKIKLSIQKKIQRLP